MHGKKPRFSSFLGGAAAATAVIGYMLFGSKNAKKNRLKVERWLEDATDDVLDKMERIKKASRDKYEEIVEVINNEEEEEE
jgi:hypothetical protein